MEKINVVYLIDTISCNTAGTQKQLIQMIERLNPEAFKPYLVCLYTSPWMRENPLPCEVIDLGYIGFVKVNFPKVTMKLAEILRDKKIHIVQTFFEDSVFVAYLGVILSRTNTVLLSSRRDIGLPNRPWYHSAFKLILPLINLRFDGIVTNSKTLKSYVAKNEKVDNAKISVIYNGVNIAADSRDKPEFFDKYRHDLWIGITASLTPVKRIDILLRALAEVKNSSEEKINFGAVVLGDGPEKDALASLSKELGLDGFVYFIGAVNNITPYIQELDIAVLCSDREGLSNSIIEYMSCALPVVATDVGGNTELVDRSNGLCVPPGDYQALGGAIKKLLLDPELRCEMGKASLKKVKRSYSWGKTMDKLESYYYTLLKDKGIEINDIFQG